MVQNHEISFQGFACLTQVPKSVLSKVAQNEHNNINVKPISDRTGAVGMLRILLAIQFNIVRIYHNIGNVPNSDANGQLTPPALEISPIIYAKI
jgi:hypothetical protein